jgi:N-acetylneuraminate synthase
MYFIADIAANHDGSLDRALHLMSLAKDAGADCAKFQHFRADHIVSDLEFTRLGKLSHQSGWTTSVFEAYWRASVPWEWTADLAAHAEAIGMDFMSTPYDVGAVEHLSPYVGAFKVGSGDIDYMRLLHAIAATGKRVFVATGASSTTDVDLALRTLRGCDVVLMQCNTNYTGSPDNFDHLNLKALTWLRRTAPLGTVLGLSDHTPGHVSVLGAVALGARVIEKHLTDDTSRTGPDHAFSMDPASWRAMVDDTALLLRALGDGVKRVQDNEQETRVVQRRSVCASHDLPAGTTLTEADLRSLRPALPHAISPRHEERVVGRTTRRAVRAGEALTWGALT